MKIRVPYNYLPYEFSNNRKIFEEWKKLIKSSDFTLGRFMAKFENNFKKYIKAKYCFGTNNGTDALILSLKSLGIGIGDEVITVCNSFYATAGAIHAVGAKVVFVDCDERFQINVNMIENAITKKTKAIVPVHWGGASPEINKIVKIAKKYNIYIVEDACMGIGALVNKRSPGTFGNVNAFSMHPLKSLNVMGDGGIVATNNKRIAKWIAKYRNHGMINRDKIDMWGVNYRLQPLQAIVANENLKKIDRFIKIRNNNAKLMDKYLLKLYPNIIIPPRIKDNTETFALYMILCKQRNKLKKFLIDRGIEAKIHYPVPLHLQKPSKKLGYKKGDFPIAEEQASKLLTLPVHQYLKTTQIKYMIKTIKQFYIK